MKDNGRLINRGWNLLENMGKQKMIAKIKYSIITAALALGIFVSSSAHAYQIAPNSQGSWALGTYSFFTIQGSTYRIVMDHVGDPGVVTFGNLVNGILDTVVYDSQVMSNFQVQKYNSSTQTYGDVAGNLTGSINLGYTNVNFDANSNQIAAIQGTSTSTGNMTISGTLDGMNISGNFAIAPGYMPVSLGQFGGLWDSLVNTFGTNGTLNFSMGIDRGFAQTGYIDAWYYGALQGYQVNMNINGVNTLVSLSGDIHSSLGAPIPEPATMGLLISGLLGGAATRRKRQRASKVA